MNDLTNSKFIVMIKKVITNKTSIRRIETREGETIETKVRRVMSNNEPIHDEAPLIYTERKEGVILTMT